MNRSLRTRLDRLEHRLPNPDVRWIDWDAVFRGEPIPWTEADQAKHQEAREKSPAVIFLREQYARLGMPQPATLDDVDVIEEAIRLA